MNALVSPSGVLTLGDKQFKCALGRSGVSANKSEGDGATPAGSFPIREVFYRADRISKPESPFKTLELKEEDGWCDDPGDRNYNRQIKIPYAANAENLWRQDDIYDVIAVLGHNDNPVIPGKGSAIFMHVARPNYAPTEGCIAISLQDLLEILKNLSPDSRVVVD